MFENDAAENLTSAEGKESGGTTNRWQERFIYGYDAAGNLSNRVQNVQTNVFNVDILNQLTSVVRTNTSATVRQMAVRCGYGGDSPRGSFLCPDQRDAAQQRGQCPILVWNV